MIQNSSRCSNSQNKVSDADFFSNHAFHRAIERHSRNIPAPRVAGTAFNTYWFYERARGQYVNAQAKMTIREKREFLRNHPRSQLISKTDLAKFENSWQKLPHIVSRGAQKSFLVFAEYVGKLWGTNGAEFDNDVYFKELVAKAILFRFVEGMVSEAKRSWYGGDYRAQIVTYTIAKLASIIHEQAIGCGLNLKDIWSTQRIPLVLAQQLESIAKIVSTTITVPPVPGMNVGEWCKKEDCWNKVLAADIPLAREMRDKLVSRRALERAHNNAVGQATEDAVINAVVDVVRLGQAGCWRRLSEWSRQYSPLVGRDADLVRLASRGGWVPADRQAQALMKILRRLELEGFRRN